MTSARLPRLLATNWSKVINSRDANVLKEGDAVCKTTRVGRNQFQSKIMKTSLLLIYFLALLPKMAI